jgi:diguanylate cyclase (GGDEF)-like protein
MGSFRVKLVAYFALIAILPLGVAFYGLDTLAKSHEANKIYNRLKGDVRFASADYAQQLDTEERRPQPLTLVDLLSRVSLALDPRDTLVAVQNSQVVSGAGAGGLLALSPGTSGRVMLIGRPYRGYVGTQAITLPGARLGVQFAALADERELDQAVARDRWRIALGLLAAVIALGGLTYMLGHSIVRSLSRLVRGADEIAGGQLHARVEVRGRDEFAQVAQSFNRMAAQLEQRLEELEDERRRAREGTARFAEVLAATHDPEQLLRVIVESAVAVTGAAGGVVIGPEGELARTGDLEAGTKLLEVPLKAGRRSFGTVVLSGESFDDGRSEAAVSLASHAVVALENARLHRVVERQARIDELTGLENRRAVEEKLRSELARAARYNGELCLVFVDLDNFKDVNDRYGHPFGDHVLYAVAETLAAGMRDVDTAGRWGGEEFALVLPGTDIDGGAAVAERARRAIAERVIVTPDGAPLVLSASFGVAAFPSNQDVDTLISLADEALYRAKRSGKNRVGTPLGLVER